MSVQGLMISVSGVRGRVGEALTNDIVDRYAAGFGAWSLARSTSKEIVVARDSRVSGPMFHRVVVAALQSVGANVVDLDMAPTPTVQMAVEERHAAGERAITSHIDRILKLSMIDVDAIRRQQFRVALDTCHGAGSTVFPQLFAALGCEVQAINESPDGLFHRPPEPVAENLGELSELVRRTGSVVGFATDPDVDRLALVDDKGRAIGEDYTLALAARVVLRRRRGPVVVNLSTSRIVDDMTAEFGSSVVRAPVGEVNVAVRMRDEGAVVGGEGNGGVILPELHLGRDAPLAAALILQLLVDEGPTVSGIVARFPQYRIVKDKLDRPDGSLDKVYETLRAAFPDGEVDTQDGLRLSWPDRWVHVRPSGTEPIVRVIAEAPTEKDARDLIARCRAPLDALAA